MVAVNDPAKWAPQSAIPAQEGGFSFRTAAGRQVDAREVKSGHHGPHEGLRYFVERVVVENAVQLVADLKKPLANGRVEVVNLAAWLDKLNGPTLFVPMSEC